MKKLVMVVLLLAGLFSSRISNAGSDKPSNIFVFDLANEVAIAYNEMPQLFHRYVDYTKMIKVDVGKTITRVNEYGMKEKVKPVWVVADITIVESANRETTIKKKYVTRLQFEFLYRFEERSDAKAIVKKETVSFASR
ncbi:MAG: hypothetical protein PHP62_02945 [Candidatus Moranbacteria bacterium]|nr:hypothetical protein [Candidatus Moranbacteria bacterium]